MFRASQSHSHSHSHSVSGSDSPPPPRSRSPSPSPSPSRSRSRSRSSRAGGGAGSGSVVGRMVGFFCGRLTSTQATIWRIIAYMLIFYVAITYFNLANLNLAQINTAYEQYQSQNTQTSTSQLKTIQTQTQAQQEARIQDILMLGGRVHELESRLLKCSDAKTLYRKEWGKMYCEKYHKGPRGGYCVSRNVTADNEILCVPVADSILSLVGPTATVYDFGCGVGQYGKYWTKHSNITWTGFDGAEGIEEKTDNWVKFLDLTEATYMPPRDWSISLEVGEHIPEAYQDLFLDNLHRHNKKGIILTWGVPGQRGTNHINLRENSWVIAKLDALGYDYLEQHSKQTRKAVQDKKSLVWFVDTYMAFKRRVPPSAV